VEDSAGFGGTGSSAAAVRPIRGFVLALVLTALAAFLLSGGAAAIAARSIAEKFALAEAARSAETLGAVIFAPRMSAVIAGDVDAKAALDAAVTDRQSDNSVVRVKVWDRDGTVLYSDAPRMMGKSFPVTSDITDSIDRQQSHAEVSNLSDPDNVAESTLDRLVEVYVPLDLPSGERLALEVYSSEARVSLARSELIKTLVPFVLLALVVLVLAQLPVSVWLLRKVSRAAAERGRLLLSSVTASERERRAIAHDLNNTVVRDLIGADAAMKSVQADLPGSASPEFRGSLDRLSGVVSGSVGSLRTLVVAVYPPDLAEAGLADALDRLADRLRLDGVDVTVTVDLRFKPSPAVTAAAYRCTRECLTNITKHAGASQAWIELAGDARWLRLSVADNGHGVAPAVGLWKAGHLGLQLMRDAVHELDGTLSVRRRPGGGTEISIVLPLQAMATQG
jgi:signal transduction histidine kinase